MMRRVWVRIYARWPAHGACFTGLTGLSQEQVAKMASDHSIYLTKDGRISIAGVSPPRTALAAPFQ